MKKMLLFLIGLFFFLISNAKTESVLQMDKFRIDHDKKLILINQPIDTINAAYSRAATLSLDAVYRILEPVDSFRIGIGYRAINASSNDKYTLYFSQLPIIDITTESMVPVTTDSAYILANFTIIDDDPRNEITSNIGIKFRGSSSLSFPKKSFKLEFWTGTNESETKDVSLLGMSRDDDDWNLQAMFNEPLMLRGKTNNELWRQIYKPYYKDKEPEAIMGVHLAYADLFVNGEYRGIYCIGERVDRKQLKLKKYKDGIKGELYKGISWGAPTFISSPPFTNGSYGWGGFEYEYPDEIEPYWNNIYDFVDFVRNSSDERFYSQIQVKFDMDNAVDYFIYLNLLRATDNAGKNIFVAKYDSNKPYYYVPWDLDLTMGYVWSGDGTHLRKRESNNDVLSNGMYDRLYNDSSPGGFVEKLRARWSVLRTNDILNHDHIMKLFTDNFNYLFTNGAYERESIAWPDYYNPDIDEELSYLSNWIQNRLSFLDSEFGYSNPSAIAPVERMENKLFRIYPNPTSESVRVDTPSESDVDVSIYNLSGQLVLQSTANVFNNKISLNKLDNGVYFIRLSNRERSEVSKIILQK